jgi:hypothetical protein
VNADGTVDYDASMDTFLSGRGTNELRIQGVSVTIDATELSGSYLFTDYASYANAAEINLKLLPGDSHFFYTYGGSMFYFTVNANGTVDYDTSMDSFVSGRGTGELRLEGLTIEIDATTSGGAYVTMDYAAYNAASTLTVVLLPGQHFIYTATGKLYYFTVTLDGLIDYDPELEGIFTGRGTMKLGFAGDP